MIEHTTRAFDTELRELARKIAEMGRLDGEQITAAIGALVKRGIALAKRVIATDDQVDALQRAIEEKAVATIARRQPMAVDLREIIGALRIERVGDLAQNIAKRVLLLTDEFRIHEVVAGYANESRDVRIPPIGLAGILQIPKNAYALVAFAHGSGSSRLSPRNTVVARALNDRGIATLLFDLLTSAEEADRANVFNIPLLADRLVDAVHWIDGQASVAKLPLGLFGASTGAAAALVAAAKLPRRIGAVVSRGGRPDLAGDALEKVRAPTLLIVGGADFGVIELNEQALARLRAPKALEIVPGASHLFPEPGALEAVIDLAGTWFERHLGTRSAERRRTARTKD